MLPETAFYILRFSGELIERSIIVGKMYFWRLLSGQGKSPALIFPKHLRIKNGDKRT